MPRSTHESTQAMAAAPFDAPPAGTPPHEVRGKDDRVSDGTDASTHPPRPIQGRTSQHGTSQHGPGQGSDDRTSDAPQEGSHGSYATFFEENGQAKRRTEVGEIPRDPENDSPFSKQKRHVRIWRALVYVARESIRRFYRDGGPMLGGSLAFYSVLSAAPMLVLIAVFAGLLLGEHTAKRELLLYIQDRMGPDGAKPVIRFFERAQSFGARSAATFLGGLFLLYAGSRMFAQLRHALNIIFGVRVRRTMGLGKHALTAIRKRAGVFLMVLLCGVMFTALLVLKVAVTASIPFLAPAVGTGALVHFVEFLVTNAALSALFAMLFRSLPDAKIQWSDAWFGAVITTILYEVSAVAFAMYLAFAVGSSPYGAVGSLALFLLWLHFNAQVFLLGASCTRVWAEYHGRTILPASHAIRLVELDHDIA